MWRELRRRQPGCANGMHSCEPASLLHRCLCRQIVKLELEPHLHTCFKHFVLFTKVLGGALQGSSALTVGATPCLFPSSGLLSANFPVLQGFSIPPNGLWPLQGNRLIDDRELAPMKELIEKLTRGGP